MHSEMNCSAPCVMVAMLQTVDVLHVLTIGQVAGLSRTVLWYSAAAVQEAN